MLKFSNGVIWGAAQPFSLFQSMVSMWSVNTFPKANWLTGGFGFICSRLASRICKLELSSSDGAEVEEEDWHLKRKVWSHSSSLSSVGGGKMEYWKLKIKVKSSVWSFKSNPCTLHYLVITPCSWQRTNMDLFSFFWAKLAWFFRIPRHLLAMPDDAMTVFHSDLTLQTFPTWSCRSCLQTDSQPASQPALPPLEMKSEASLASWVVLLELAGWTSGQRNRVRPDPTARWRKTKFITRGSMTWWCTLLDFFYIFSPAGKFIFSKKLAWPGCEAQSLEKLNKFRERLPSSPDHIM